MTNEFLPEGSQIADEVDALLKKRTSDSGKERLDDFLTTAEERVKSYLHSRKEGNWFAPKQSADIAWLQQKADSFSNLHTLGTLEAEISSNSWEHAEAEFKNQFTADPLILTYSDWVNRLAQIKEADKNQFESFRRTTLGFFQSITYPLPIEKREKIRLNRAVQFNILALFGVSVGFQYYKDHFGGDGPFEPLVDIMQQGGVILKIKDYKLKLFWPKCTS